SLYCSWSDPLQCSERASSIIHRVSENDPVSATRIALAYHTDPLETPYFPDSTSSGKIGVGYSFLLPSTMKRYYREHGELNSFYKYLINIVEDLLKITKNKLGLERVLFDYSISPWMENSVVDLIEAMGYKFLSPGFNYGVYRLNEIIQEIARIAGRATGFNEVMLPYAEDSLLIKAGREGILRASTLLAYTATCVAGPDMIVIPSSKRELARFILDTYSIWRVKRRPMALRAIPVSGLAGDTIDLGKFGKVPIINY
ncbi:MAG: DUF711 domain-containing protein, partial [Thermoprotei archaeon]